MTDTRKDFEAWLTSNFEFPAEWDQDWNCYKEFSCDMAWKGWQAGAQHERDRAAKISSDLGKALTDFAANQKPLDPDFQAVLMDNLWELYARGDRGAS